MYSIRCTDVSLSESRINGLITNDEFTVLRQLAHDPTKIAVYDSSTPLVLLRNPKQSANVKIPRLDQVSAGISYHIVSSL